ncbi:flagellar motor switch protein FliG [Pararhizobium sp. IMCC21322]|uniref:flagellar motor switch protein FliG n=1 Tax=Pararhizobium sp. IMCC21322 TaxID=3067903 RepID=UPI0027416BF8|nr:flagellar motor switch protein FliG [Pararhizobium sp. IMCC21322]
MNDLAAIGELQISESAQNRKLTGADRAAVLLLSLGGDNGIGVWERLDEIEIKEISLAMARLGPVSPGMMEDLLVDFVAKLSAKGAVMGNYESTERLLACFLPNEQVSSIMEEIRGPAGRTMWEKLSNVQETLLANYLKNEYPQTVAVVLSKIKSDHASRVLSLLPEEFSLEVVNRMLRMEAVQTEILDKIEQTLRVEFMANLSRGSKRDPHEHMADIFNSFDRQTETRFMSSLEEENEESADKIKALMFTFDDLAKLDGMAIQSMLRFIERPQLALALKGAGDSIRDVFFENMSQRATKLLKDDMEALGPVRLKDVDEAQSGMVNKAKEMADRGEIAISSNQGEDELVY